MAIIPLTGIPVTTQGEWQEPDSQGCLLWRFQRPTRVYGFEIRDVIKYGDIVSVRVGNKDQLIKDGVPIEHFLAGPMIGLDTIFAGMDFTIATRDFIGQLRPIGEQHIDF